MSTPTATAGPDVWSKIRYADICYAAGRYEQAAGLYAQALTDFGEDNFYRALLLNSLGHAHWQNRELEQALTDFGRIAEIPDAPLRAQALFAMVNLHADMGQPQKAQDAYRRLLDGFPDSDLVQVAREFVSGV